MRFFARKTIQPSLILSDPPYGVTQQSWDVAINWQWWWRIVDALNCPVLLFAIPPFSHRLASSNPCGYSYEWVWEKDRVTGHLNSGWRPMQAHEVVQVFWPRRGVFNPQKTTGHRPVNAYYTGHSGAVYGASKTMAGGGQTDRFPRTVLEFPAVPTARLRHPNEKPQELLRYLVRTYSKPGDLILDPFAGCGSTLEAAESEGRRAVGIELRKGLLL